MNKRENWTISHAAEYVVGEDFWTAHGVRFSDGPAGLRMQETEKSDAFGLHGSAAATCFPAHSALANSWDRGLAEEVGRRIGEEAAASGVDVLLAPALNVKRNPLNGRNFEYFSEEPLICGELGAAYVRGVRSTGVGACVKHFAANNKELGRSVSDSVVDIRTLREIYLRPFEIAVKNSSPECVMTAYNRVNGVYCSENEWLLSDVLRGEWGFEGTVVTDWGGTFMRHKAIAAGCDLEMPACTLSAGEITSAIERGELEDEKLFACADRVKKLCSRPHPKIDNCDMAEHAAFAEKAAESCAVLLKNNNDILPLNKGLKIAVVGEAAENAPIQGGGSSHVNPNCADNLLARLKSMREVIGYCAGYRRGKKTSKKLIKRAVRLAKSADVAVCCLALYTGDSEGKDRLDLRLPQSQIDLVQSLCAAGVKVVCVLSCGGAVDTSWDSGVEALLYVGLSGQGAPQAIAKLLTGEAAPCGRLAETFFNSPEELPSFNDFSKTPYAAVYTEGMAVGYRHYTANSIRPKYAFGFGLGYTKFAFSNVSIDEKKVTFTVKNIGEREGVCVAQAYIELPSAASSAGLRLAGFTRVFLGAGEQKEAEICLNERDFCSFSAEQNRWVTVGGTYRIFLGESSDNLSFSSEINLKGDCDFVAPCNTSLLSPAPYALTKNKRGRVIADMTTPFGELINSRAILVRLVVRTTFRIFRNNDMVHGSLKYAQVRMGAQFAKFTPRQAEGIVDFFNGKYFKAAWKFMTKNRIPKDKKRGENPPSRK